MPSLAEWLIGFLLPSLASIAMTYVVLRWYFRHELAGKAASVPEHVKLDGNGRLVLGGIVSVVGVLLTASAMKRNLGLPTCIAAFVFVGASASNGGRVRGLWFAR